MTKCQVAIIGAGPYGLSIAAHLRARGIDFRIFGNPMGTWLTQMPKGMRLKSEGFASSLYDPDSQFTLKDYCNEKRLPYADLGLPVPIETFTSYGLEFQKKYASNLENKTVVSCVRSAGSFRLTLSDGESFIASKVVVAVGLTHFAHLPSNLEDLPSQVMTHSSVHSDLGGFKGKSVIVLGAGASALDLAALLHQAGASVQLVARKKVIKFHDPAIFPRPLLQRIRRPLTGIGNGWKLVFYANAPGLFQRMPESYRREVVRTTLGPAPGWFIKDEVVGKVPFHLGFEIVQAKERNAQIELELSGENAARKTLVGDHLIAATGYKVDLRRLQFIEDNIRQQISSVDHTPVLSPNFECSVPGMYFVGTSSANAFGPLMRFAVGARFTAPKVAGHLAKSFARSKAETKAITETAVAAAAVRD